MKFSAIFWTTLKVRASIRIQDAIVDSITESSRRSTLSANLPSIIKELLENQNQFGSFLEKQRKLIQIEKALKNLHLMDITEHQKEIARDELLKVKQYLEK